MAIANKISLNVKKSNLLLFRTKNEPSSIKINLVLNGSPIEEKCKAKYLGVILDHKLTYEHHIKQIRSKLIKGNAILAKVRHYIPTNLLTNTYNAHVQPHIDYGHILWGYAAKIYTESIFSQRKKSIRMMNFVKSKRESTQPLFKEKKILPLDRNLLLNSGKTLWKAANSMLCPSLLDHLFNMRDNSQTFHTPFKGLDVSQGSITYAGTKAWNQIPLAIRSSPSLNSFKIKYKEHLLSTL